jgi:hypothetical protein
MSSDGLNKKYWGKIKVLVAMFLAERESGKLSFEELRAELMEEGYFDAESDLKDALWELLCERRIELCEKTFKYR